MKETIDTKKRNPEPAHPDSDPNPAPAASHAQESQECGQQEDADSEQRGGNGESLRGRAERRIASCTIANKKYCL